MKEVDHYYRRTPATNSTPEAIELMRTRLAEIGIEPRARPPRRTRITQAELDSLRPAAMKRPKRIGCDDFDTTGWEHG